MMTAEERCLTEDGVVGRRPCPAYGMWGAALEAPYIFIRVGSNFRYLPRTQPAKPVLRSTTDMSTVIDPGSDTSFTVTEQIGVATSPVSYLGFEVEMSPTYADDLGPGSRTYAAGAQLLAGVYGGARAFKLGVELAGGGRFVEMGNDVGEEWTVEARARADLWLSPWVTIGGAVGTSLLDRGEWMLGLHLGVHSYSYGGH
jgi:hypothetical protein